MSSSINPFCSQMFIKRDRTNYFFFKRRSIQLAAQPRLHGYLSKGNLPNINLDSIVDENNTHVFTDHQNQ